MPFSYSGSFQILKCRGGALLRNKKLDCECRNLRIQVLHVKNFQEFNGNIIYWIIQSVDSFVQSNISPS